MAVATWFGPFRVVALTGIFDLDSLYYHLPIALRFFQTGSITGVHHMGENNVPEFYPVNNELLHGVGMLAFERDPLSLLINFGWLVLFLLAAGASEGPEVSAG